MALTRAAGSSAAAYSPPRSAAAVSPSVANGAGPTRVTATPAAVASSKAVGRGCTAARSTWAGIARVLTTRPSARRSSSPVMPCSPGVRPVPSDVSAIGVVLGNTVVIERLAGAAIRAVRTGASAACARRAWLPSPSTRSTTTREAGSSPRPGRPPSTPSACSAAGMTSARQPPPYAGGSGSASGGGAMHGQGAVVHVLVQLRASGPVMPARSSTKVTGSRCMRHVEQDLVEGAVEEGGVDGDDRVQAAQRQAGGRGGGVLLGDADVEGPVGVLARRAWRCRSSRPSRR